jgi:type VII secretion effector (TIGR04197 family)
MAGEIKINRAEFDAAMQSISGLKSRSVESSSNFKTDTMPSTDAPSVTAYITAISSIKDYMVRYNTLLQSDIDNLTKIADNFDEIDNRLATHPPASSLPGSDIHR